MRQNFFPTVTQVYQILQTSRHFRRWGGLGARTIRKKTPKIKQIGILCSSAKITVTTTSSARRKWGRTYGIPLQNSNKNFRKPSQVYITRVTSEEQNCSIPNRTIFSNLFLVRDLIKYTKTTFIYYKSTKKKLSIN